MLKGSNYKSQRIMYTSNTENVVYIFPYNPSILRRKKQQVWLLIRTPFYRKICDKNTEEDKFGYDIILSSTGYLICHYITSNRIGISNKSIRSKFSYHEAHL